MYQYVFVYLRGGSGSLKTEAAFFTPFLRKGKADWPRRVWTLPFMYMGLRRTTGWDEVFLHQGGVMKYSVLISFSPKAVPSYFDWYVFLEALAPLPISEVCFFVQGTYSHFSNQQPQRIHIQVQPRQKWWETTQYFHHYCSLIFWVTWEATTLCRSPPPKPWSTRSFHHGNQASIKVIFESAPPKSLLTETGGFFLVKLSGPSAEPLQPKGTPSSGVQSATLFPASNLLPASSPHRRVLTRAAGC